MNQQYLNVEVGDRVRLYRNMFDWKDQKQEFTVIDKCDGEESVLCQFDNGDKKYLWPSVWRKYEIVDLTLWGRIKTFFANLIS